MSQPFRTAAPFAMLLLLAGAAAAGKGAFAPDVAMRLLVKHAGRQAEALAARGRLDPTDTAEQDRWLDRGKAPEVLAVLGLELEGHRRLEIPRLALLLDDARDRLVATAIVKLLGNRRKPAADKVLIEHLARQGRADETAALALISRKSKEAQRALFDCGSQLEGRNKACLICLRGLSKVPGNNVTRLLVLASSDRSPKIQEAAKAALKVRKAAGLPVTLEIKKVPYTAPRVTTRRSGRKTDKGSGGEGTKEEFFDENDPRGGRFLRERLQRRGLSQQEVDRQVGEFREEMAEKYERTLN